MLSVRADNNVPNDTQVWMRDNEVLDITTSSRARFMAMFGLMQVPDLKANKVLLSSEDYAALAEANCFSPTPKE